MFAVSDTHIHLPSNKDNDLAQLQTALSLSKTHQLDTHDTTETGSEENDSDGLSRSSSTIPSLISTSPNLPNSSLNGVSKLHDLAEVERLDTVRSPDFQARLFETLERIPGHAERKGFFPHSAFTDIVSEKTVAEELRRCCRNLESTTIRQLSHTICGTKSFRRVFALLVLVGKLVDIELFIKEDVSDGDLPLWKYPYQDSNLFQFSRNVGTSEPLQPLSCFRSWDTVAVWSFEEWQWTTLAPFFDAGKHKDVKHFILPEQIPLPFTQDTRYGVDFKAIQGGFSTVSTVHIHPAHHNFSTPEVR